MSASGHNRTFGDVGAMSGLPPKADMAAHFMSTRPGRRRQNLRWPSYGSGISGTNAI